MSESNRKPEPGDHRPGSTAPDAVNEREGPGLPRRSVPEATRTAIFTASRRRCCLCVFIDGDSESQRGQIAHIDRDRTNNAESNLVFLCLRHHDEYDSKTSQSARWTPAELRKYRDLLPEKLAAMGIPALRSETVPAMLGEAVQSEGTGIVDALVAEPTDRANSSTLEIDDRPFVSTYDEGAVVVERERRDGTRLAPSRERTYFVETGTDGTDRAQGTAGQSRPEYGEVLLAASRFVELGKERLERAEIPWTPNFNSTASEDLATMGRAMYASEELVRAKSVLRVAGRLLPDPRRAYVEAFISESEDIYQHGGTGAARVRSQQALEDAYSRLKAGLE